MASEVTSTLHLTVQQSHLLHLGAGAPDSSYRIQSLVQVAGGSLDPERLAQSLTALVREHPVLRLQWAPGDGTGMARIGQPYNPLQAVIDLEEQAPDEQGRSLADLWAAAKVAPLDLAAGRPLQVTLLITSPTSATLLFTASALSLDRQGLFNLVRTLAQHYAGVLPDPSTLDEESVLPVPWVELVDWLAEIRTGEAGGPGRLFWRSVREQRLEQGEGTVPALFGNREGLPAPRQSHRLRLSPSESRALFTTARRYSVSPSALLHAAWQVTLSRLTGGLLTEIGLQADGRSFPELTGTIGPLARYLPISISGNPAEGLACWASHLEERVGDALAWQETFDPRTLVDGELGWSPLVGYLYQTLPAVWQVGSHGWQVTDLEQVEDGWALRLVASLADAGLELRFDWDPARLSEEMVQLFARATGAFVHAFLAEPERSVTTLDLLSPAEREWVLSAGTGPDLPLPTESLQALFEQQVQATPDAIALTVGSAAVTYAELNEQANRIAWALKARGVSRNSLVAIFLHRSPRMVAALLGVLKAGGAYVPVDPSYPSERIRFMLADAAAVVTLNEASLLDQLPDGQQTLVLDAAVSELAVASPLNPPNSTEPSDLCYVIYTSGSTGRPKGTLVHHRGVVNYLTWAASAYQVEAGTGAPVHSPLSFDLTVTSLWTPLVTGRTVRLVPEGAVMDLLEGLIEGEGYSLVKITPAHLEALRSMIPPERAAAWTRALVIGGEALHAESLAFWQEHAPATRLINEYGPTETVVGCAVWEVAPSERVGAVPIGSPIANTHLYVLDERMQLLPPGIPGELYIGGAGVANGYLNRPDLTAERFLPDPFAADPQARLYRTGDLALLRPDGAFVYLGRRDNQVKVRGYRIELGEIEAAIASHPQVRSVAVLAPVEEGGQRRLIAYVVAQDGQLTVEGLRAYVAGQLPSYMLPAQFVFLAQMPLTPNGKIDRGALPDPSTVAAESAKAALSPLEERIRQIWGEILGQSEIDPLKPFQELGGNSIHGIQVVARMRAAFNLEIPIRLLFDHPTVRAAAAAVDELLTQQLLESVEHLSEEEAAAMLRSLVGEGGSEVG